MGVPDPVKGQRLACFVVQRASGPMTTELVGYLIGLVTSALGKPLRPSAVEVVPDLPRTRNAKIVRGAIRRAYLGQPLGSTSAIENPEALTEIAAAGRRARQAGQDAVTGSARRPVV